MKDAGLRTSDFGPWTSDVNGSELRNLAIGSESLQISALKCGLGSEVRGLRSGVRSLLSSQAGVVTRRHGEYRNHELFTGF
jgi:hypothetical protein